MSKDYSQLLDHLLDGESLAESQAYDLMNKLAEGELPAALAGALLAGLRAKGETADEIRGFATAMRELAVHPDIPDGRPTVDTVGTGGAGSGRVRPDVQPHPLRRRSTGRRPVERCSGRCPRPRGRNLAGGRGDHRAPRVW